MASMVLQKRGSGRPIRLPSYSIGMFAGDICPEEQLLIHFILLWCLKAQKVYCSLRGCIRKNWNGTENYSWNNMSHDHVTPLTDTSTRASLDLLSREILSPDPSMAPAQG